MELSHCIGTVCNGRWPTVSLTSFAGLGNPGFDAFPQNLALKLYKNGQHSGHGSPSRRGTIQRLGQ